MAGVKLITRLHCCSQRVLIRHNIDFPPPQASTVPFLVSSRRICCSLFKMGDSARDVLVHSFKECEDMCLNFASITCTDTTLGKQYCLNAGWNLSRALDAFFTGDVANGNNDEPQVPDPVEQPQVPDPVEQPQVPDPVEQPQVPEPVEQPQVPEPVEQPQVPEPVEQPQVPDPVEQPQVPEPVEQPQVPDPVEQPQVPDPVEQPQVPDPVEQPQVPDPVEQPQVPDPVEQPTDQENTKDPPAAVSESPVDDGPQSIKQMSGDKEAAGNMKASEEMKTSDEKTPKEDITDEAGGKDRLSKKRSPTDDNAVLLTPVKRLKTDDHLGDVSTPKKDVTVAVDSCEGDDQSEQVVVDKNMLDKSVTVEGDTDKADGKSSKKRVSDDNSVRGTAAKRMKSGNSSGPSTSGPSSSGTSASVGTSVQNPAVDNLKDPFTIKVLSWNIDGLDTNHRQQRLQGVIDVLLAEKPDVVFFQEVIPEHMPTIQEKLSDYECIPANNDGYFTVVLLHSATVLPLKHTITPFQGSVMGRTLTEVYVNIKGFDFFLLMSHLESTRDHAAERRSQLKTVFTKMQNAKVGFNALFGGDLNLNDRDVATVGLPPNVTDLWQATGSRPEARYTWDTTRNTNVQLRGTFKPRCRFDRFYFKQSKHKNVDPKYFELVGIQQLQSCGRFCSDHWGIQAYFKIKGQYLG